MLGQKAPVGTRACAGVGESSAMDGIDRRLLESHHARVKSDSAFQSALRLMQALWRESRDLPLGQANGKPMVSALAMPVAQEKLLNFLTPAIGELATTAAPDASPRLNFPGSSYRDPETARAVTGQESRKWLAEHRRVS